ncbi:low molecular weight protein-tyrosine-phosphatase [Fluviicola taffensis]|uniref:protein-tyrosine-phosphatase n=1 Tax=Fluviicola taffensis (strain DSM 16823 / NCIMB 13979 / RW262) TaxID=755732 RepID=F2IG73_FLUTR|nr:low molecular weight protein-tyrosine-phosphatase [Fluviicola taffensis]AEA44708.1 protein tyrosine phosphatase [Fluviicola taffensis DSM 16823]
MRILMVCLGNICRSPMADGWLRHKTKQHGLNLEVDSAGTANYHVGKKPDHRMRRLSLDFGVSIDELRARQFSVADFDNYDIIFAMDQNNEQNILQLARNNKEKEKVKLLLNELHPNQNLEVPDPYYGTDANFKEVIELLDHATDAFLFNHQLITKQ